MEENTIVFAFNCTFKFLDYVHKPGSASGFMARSQGRQKSNVDTDLIQSPLKSMAALSLTVVNFKSCCVTINMKIHLKLTQENTCEISKCKRS